MTPFYVNYGRQPKSYNTQRAEEMNPASQAFAHWVAGALDQRKTALEAAWERITKYTNTRRTPPPAYKVGNAVMLSTTYLKFKMCSRKLDHEFIGPIQIQQLISPTAVRLTVPHKWKTHPTFHVAECEPFVQGNRPVYYDKTLHRCANFEADEKYAMDEIK